ncbi:MAG: O-antigen ligase family protein [Candidatus Omnitrophica bacterium]|nr:O-antigen ligase family protein [Candidatus Omnitrophota bacterium]
MNFAGWTVSLSILFLVYLPNRFNVGWKFEALGWEWYPTDLLIPILLVSACLSKPGHKLGTAIRRSPGVFGWFMGWVLAALFSTLLSNGEPGLKERGLAALTADFVWTLPILLIPILDLRKKDLYGILWVYLLLGALGGILAMAQSLAVREFSSLVGWKYVHYVTDSERRADLPLGVSTVIGAFFATVLPIGFALAVRPGKMFLRWVGAAAVFLVGMGCLFTSSRATLLLLILVSGLCALWLVWPKGSKLLPTLALTGLAVTIVVALSQLNFQRLTTFSGGYGSSEWRMRGIESALDMIRDSPIIGHGTETHFARQHGPVHGYFSTSKAHDAIYYDNRIAPSDPHNLFLLIASEWGLLGLFFYLGMLAQIGYWFYRAQENAIDPMDRLLMRGFLIGLLGVMFHSLFGSDLVRQTRMAPLFWIYCGIGIRFGAILIEERVRSGAAAGGSRSPESHTPQGWESEALRLDPKSQVSNG